MQKISRIWKYGLKVYLKILFITALSKKNKEIRMLSESPRIYMPFNINIVNVINKYYESITLPDINYLIFWKIIDKIQKKLDVNWVDSFEDCLEQEKSP